ncbi:hypothetical protein CEXT_132631 [Caerostris extrusa]|uniref:Uncharacterized protein n=1 Tax=Caerostris extrusa TaxID=172846 RepID=A0AAV4W211_CAEEX|nr:hypothetical protein CEXT_132631 [Caerostris extrusa]
MCVIGPPTVAPFRAPTVSQQSFDSGSNDPGFSLQPPSSTPWNTPPPDLIPLASIHFGGSKEQNPENGSRDAKKNGQGVLRTIFTLLQDRTSVCRDFGVLV